jgi:hypothetical protein
MPRLRGLYSVIQYVPDGARAEGANAGVAIFVPESGRVFVRTTKTLTRVRKFFAPDLKERRRIELALEALRHRLDKAQGEFKTEEEFEQFVAARADAVRLTPPRLILLTEPELRLNGLYADLVGDPDTARARGKSPPLPARLAEVFGKLEAVRKVWRPGRIPVPESGHKLNIPVAYRNGRVNYVLPQSLAPADRPEERLPKLGFNGLLIYQHRIENEEGKLVVLSSNERADREAEKRYKEVLDDFHVRFVPHDQAAEFAAEVERTAH